MENLSAYEILRRQSPRRKEYSVRGQKTEDILAFLEKNKAQHVAWLTDVHASILFPRTTDMPPEPPSIERPDGLGGGVETLLHLCHVMHRRARDLVEAVRVSGKAGEHDYRAFMAQVCAYFHETGRLERQFWEVLVKTDPLTGVYNRQGMMNDLRREWERALRDGQPACIGLADLDHFKQVNDSFGHGAGDRVLCAAAQLFNQLLRPYDIMYRYGGEEFLFCLPNTDEWSAARVLGRLCHHLAHMPVLVEGPGGRVPITCSIGVARLAPGRSVQEALTVADAALYAAKCHGRNRVEIADGT